MSNSKVGAAVIITALAVELLSFGIVAPQERSVHFVVILRPGPGWVEGKSPREMPFFREHAAYVEELAAKKKLLVGGPFKDGKGALLILAVSNEKEAREIVKDEPFVKHEMLIPELHPWYAAVPGCVEQEKE